MFILLRQATGAACITWNINFVDGVLLDENKPFSKSNVGIPQRFPLAFTWWKFCRKCLFIISELVIENKNCAIAPKRVQRNLTNDVNIGSGNCLMPSGNKPLHEPKLTQDHYNNVIMTTIASQITSLTVVYSIVYSGADQRKHQSSASLACVGGIHLDRWIPRTKGQ